MTDAPTPLRLHGNSGPRVAARRLRADLIAHVGGKPSAVQRALIDAASELKLKIAVADQRFVEQGAMSQHARNEYLAFVNSYSRLLRQLGLEAAASRVVPITETLAAERERRRVAA